MSQDTSVPTAAPALPPLLAALWTLLDAHRPAFRQERPYQRMVALVFGTLFAVARHTLTQLLLTLGLTAADWSAWYRLFSRPRLDYAQLTGCFLRETLREIPETEPYVAVVDGVQVPRHSRRMPGTAWLKCPRTPPWKPGAWRAQRFVHLAGLLPRVAGYSRALPLRWETAFPPKAVLPAGMVARREWEAALVALQWLRTQLDLAGRMTQRLLILGDGGFDVTDLWRALPERVILLTRTARNRALYALPVAEKRRGPPRKYGDRVRTPAAWLAERSGWQRVTLTVRGREIPVRYRVEGPLLVKRAATQPLFLLVVPGIDRQRRRLHRDPTFWLVSAVHQDDRWVLPLPAADLLAWAWQRWEVEVCHRELKSGFGLGEMQCWGVISTVLATQWQAWVYAVLVLAGYRTWGLTGSPLTPPARWWGGAPRWSLGTVWRGYRQALWGTSEFRALWTGTADTWRVKETWIAGMHNLLAGSLRA